MLNQDDFPPVIEFLNSQHLPARLCTFYCNEKYDIDDSRGVDLPTSTRVLRLKGGILATSS